MKALLCTLAIATLTVSAGFSQSQYPVIAQREIQATAQAFAKVGLVVVIQTAAASKDEVLEAAMPVFDAGIVAKAISVAHDDSAVVAVLSDPLMMQGFQIDLRDAVLWIRPRTSLDVASLVAFTADEPGQYVLDNVFRAVGRRHKWEGFGNIDSMRYGGFTVNLAVGTYSLSKLFKLAVKEKSNLVSGWIVRTVDSRVNNAEGSYVDVLALSAK